MTRRFLDDIRSELNALLVTGGETTANEIRPLLIDMIDSTIQDECSIFSTTQTNNLIITDNWQKINSTTYGSSSGGDGVFLKPTFASGDIETSSTPGFTYTVFGQCSFIGDNQDRYDFTVLQNGVPVGVVSSVVGHGPSDPAGVIVATTINSAGADDVYSLAVKSQNVVDQIDILSLSMTVTIQPTNNA